MSTTLGTILPVIVGTNPTIKNISYSAADWLEVKNDSPFAITVQVIGVSANSFFLTPFEHNGWPISQLLQTSQLQIKNLSIVIIPSHYYTDVATENNSPTNICTINQLSQQEAQTNTYPLYTARMNTTVSTVANTLNNTGNAPATPIIFAEPNGDNSAIGAVNINNQGQATFGDSSYAGSILVQDILSNQAVLLGSIIQFFYTNNTINKNVSFSSKFQIINGTTSGNIQLFEVIQGSAKLTIIAENSYVSTLQSIPLISIYNTASLWMSGNIGLSGDGGYQVSNGGVGQNFDIFTTFAAAGGSTTVQANIFRFSLAHQRNAFDTLVIPARTTSKVAMTFIIGQ